MIFALKLPFLVLLFLLMILISVWWPAEEGRSFARATNADEAAVTRGNRVHSNRGFSAKSHRLLNRELAAPGVLPVG